jgi:hypothetical protein
MSFFDILLFFYLCYLAIFYAQRPNKEDKDYKDYWTDG